MQNQKQFCFWKLSGIRTRLESSGSKLLLHQSVLGFKTYPCKNTKIKLMHLVKCTFLHWQSWLFDDQLVTWKMKFQKIEAICQNKLRIWTVQMSKTTANNPNNNVHYIPQGRMAKRSKAPDSRKLLARDFWYTNVWVVQIPLLSEVFKHCEVSHELKTMQNQKQFGILKAERYKDPTWELPIETFVAPECAWIQNLPLPVQKNQNDASREMHFLALTKLVVDDQLLTSKMKFQKLETICQNKLRIWTVQNGKTTANNPNSNLQYNLQGRMAERSKEPDSRKLLARDFWNTNVCVGSNPTPVRSF